MNPPTIDLSAVTATHEEAIASRLPPVVISPYRRGEMKFRRSVLISILIHLSLAALFCLVASPAGVPTLKDLLDKGGSIATSGPAPDESITLELSSEPITPPPVPNPRFAQQIVQPELPAPPPLLKPQPRYTARQAKGDGKTDTVSKFIPGSSGFPHPPYPVAALNARQEGTVRLHVTFDAEGGAASVDITGSSGIILLDTSARNFIKGNWHNSAYAQQAVDVPIVYSISNPRPVHN